MIILLLDKKMEDNTSTEKIKEKFSRIFKNKESQPRNLEFLDKIYEVIKNSKKPIRISEISTETKINKNSVRDYIKKYLEPKK